MSSLMLGQGTSSPGKRRRHFTGRWQGSVGIHEYFHIYLHSVTIAVLDEKDIECEISCKIKHFHEVPGWRNWQTQRTQNWHRSSTCRRPWSAEPPGCATSGERKDGQGMHVLSQHFGLLLRRRREQDSTGVSGETFPSLQNGS